MKVNHCNDDRNVELLVVDLQIQEKIILVQILVKIDFYSTSCVVL